ncbi:hypothetical protein [Longimicrobium sp.]|uniref:hypothetical protein n=1 Tax=Longimicrobium sp. TaxID=2029185 RepID=UPI002C3ED315|nr:hypothetical protein [Longimicrobium sp.]HSU13970.1 hypothetical protein [Longimicrobium sp.]
MSEGETQTWPGLRRPLSHLPPGYPAHSWAAIAGRYDDGRQPAMHRLVEQIIASPYVSGVFGQTSHLTLFVSQTPEVSRTANVLRIEQTPGGRIAFEYIEAFDEPRRWTRECAPDDAFATFERFLELQKWFVQSPGAEPPPA